MTFLRVLTALDEILWTWIVHSVADMSMMVHNVMLQAATLLQFQLDEEPFGFVMCRHSLMRTCSLITANVSVLAVLRRSSRQASMSPTLAEIGPAQRSLLANLELKILQICYVPGISPPILSKGFGWDLSQLSLTW